MVSVTFGGVREAEERIRFGVKIESVAIVYVCHEKNEVLIRTHNDLPIV